MYLAYIDESGKPNFKDDENIYVLTAVIVHEGKWHDAQEAVGRLRCEARDLIYRDHKQFHFNTLPELHCKDIYSGKKGFEKVALEERVSFMNRMAETLGDLDVTIQSIVILKDLLNDNELDVERLALSLMLERLEIFCQDQSNENYIEHLLIIYDSENYYWNNKRRKMIRNILSHGTSYMEFHRVLESPFFVDSESLLCLQLADIAGYLTRRFIRVELNGLHSKYDPHFSKMFERILPKFRRSKESGIIKGSGIKIYPDHPLFQGRDIWPKKPLKSQRKINLGG